MQSLQSRGDKWAGNAEAFSRCKGDCKGAFPLSSPLLTTIVLSDATLLSSTVKESQSISCPSLRVLGPDSGLDHGPARIIVFRLASVLEAQ